MKKLVTGMAILLATTLSAFSQTKNITVSGRVVDETKEPVVQATIQLLNLPDSTYAAGIATTGNGSFVLPKVKAGKYVLKISYIGYKTKYVPLQLSASATTKRLGTLELDTDAMMLAETVITAEAPQVQIVEDTVAFNSSAYRTPQGAMLEELVKKLPGAEVDDDGNVKINGKDVSKILVNGKEFFGGDVATGLKNLPVDMIDKLKTYDKKSDLARITGIDDGEEETVLDLTVKKGMNQGLFGNFDLGGGTEDRYTGRAMVNYFRDNTQVSLIARANNVNDQGFSGGGGGPRWRRNNGLTTSKEIGLNFATETDKIELGGSARYNYRGNDVYSDGYSENFLNNSSSFNNSRSRSNTLNTNFRADFRMEWRPDTLTNIIFRPDVAYTKTTSTSNSLSGTFNDDPYAVVDRPNDYLDLEALAKADILSDEDPLKDIRVNTSNSESSSKSNSLSANATLQLNRKLNSKGRNATVRADVSYSDGDSKSLSISNVHLYQVMNASGNDSTYQTNRFNTTPTKTLNYDLQFTYSEPIFRAMFLQFSYKFTYKYNKSDRSTYDFSNLGESFFDGVVNDYRGWNNYFSLLGQPLDSYLDDALSRYSEYKNYIHDIQVMLRVIREKYNLNAGIMVQPQKTRFVQRYQGVNTDTVRTVVNVTPTFDFRYRFSKLSNLRINYRGTTSQPSMSDLLDIVDDSDPLNITMGNPGLKPSFTNTFRLFYNNYIQEHQRALMAHVNYSNTRNSISNKVTYDELTGGRTTRPENINGNWNVSGAFMFNTAIDSAGLWTVNTFTNVRYNNYVGYLSLDNNSDSRKNTTKTAQIGEQLTASFRNSWLEVSLDGSLDYTHTRNLLQSQSNLDTWQFSYGGYVNVYLPWGTSLSSDIHQNSRRGYNDSSMNTNELVWNLQLSQSFLKGNALTVSLQFYDILRNQSNFSRVINAMQRSDTQYNSINSYAMLHAVYRINLFGGKSKGAARPDRPGRPGGDGPRGNGFGGRPFRGGFGGR